jgi:F-type H+-transporting ATPase subunit a
MSEVMQRFLPNIVIFNFALVALFLIGLALYATRRELAEVPDPVQNAAESALDWFVQRAKAMRPDGATVIAPVLASLFFFILSCNLLSLVALPIVRIPPTSYYSGTLTLALIAIIGSTVISARFKGAFGAFKELFWPNPLQLVAKLSDALSLSLRLFGNIGGEFLVTMLIVSIAPYGIPLFIHILGLIPAVIQPMVFTLLTASFLAESIHVEQQQHPTTTAEIETSKPEQSASAGDEGRVPLRERIPDAGKGEA